jgi:hypothetical protein
MTDDAKLTFREKRELRREFEQLGRESVRHKLHNGGFGVSRRADFALTWLGLQEAEDEKIKRWTLDAAVIAAALSAIAVLAALGVIK